MRISKGYIIRRLIIYVIVIWVAATINFAIPRLAPGDPITAILQRLSLQGMRMEESAKMIEEYRKMFGLDANIFIQYIKSLTSYFRFELGYSLTYFPMKVTDLIKQSIPWTIGLLATAVVIAFAIGISIGALLAWRETPKLVKMFTPLLMIFAAIPYYLIAILLLFIFAFGLNLFPASGICSLGTTVSFSLKSIVDVVYHSILPALSIILTGIGGWALGMRGMMITIEGEDYLILAKAKGLKNRRIFWHYAVRNAILPQVTALAMSLGTIAGGAVLVEVIFAYPGVGSLLYTAISNSDYTLIQGITFVLVVAVATAVLILDLIYPLLDPRITYRER